MSHTSILTRAPILGVSAAELAPIVTIADVEQLEAVPIAERLTVGSIYQLIARAATTRPETAALTFLPLGLASDTPVRVTTRELFETVTQAANLFYRLGVGPNDAVAILLPNLPAAYIALWGASTAGIACPVNPLLSQAHLAEILRAANVRVIVTIGPGLDADLWAKVAGLPALVPSLTTILTAGGEVDGQSLDFGGEFRREPGDRLVSGRAIALEDPASCFHTGGTTARPKLVTHSHRHQLVCAVQGLLGRDLREGDVLLSALPVFHVIAGIASGLIALSAGVELLLPGVNGFRNPFLLQDFWKIIERHRVTTFSAVPTVLSALLDIPIDANISSLRYVACGAAPLPVSLIQAFEAKVGAPIVEAYGMTEATTLIATNPRGGERRPGSVGFRAPYQDIRIAAVDEAGCFVHDCAVDEPGTIFLRGPNVVHRYTGAVPEATSTIPGWFETGDLGRIDADGYLWLTGRSKDLIIRSGHNIDPRLIEEALHQHPAVAAAAAVGRPDSYAGEVPVAFVTLRDGQAATPEELQHFAREHVSERPAAPAEIIILKTLPMTALGKIYKPALRAHARARTLVAACAPIAESAGGRLRAEPAQDGDGPIRLTIMGVAPDRRAALVERLQYLCDRLNVQGEVFWEGDDRHPSGAGARGTLSAPVTSGPSA